MLEKKNFPNTVLEKKKNCNVGFLNFSSRLEGVKYMFVCMCISFANLTTKSRLITFSIFVPFIYVFIYSSIFFCLFVYYLWLPLGFGCIYVIIYLFHSYFFQSIHLYTYTYSLTYSYYSFFFHSYIFIHQISYIFIYLCTFPYI